MTDEKEECARKNLESEVDLESISKKICNANYWSSNLWMEMMATYLFNSNDHSYSIKNNPDYSRSSIKEKISTIESKKIVEQVCLNEKTKVVDALLNEIIEPAFIELGMQNSIEIQCYKETQNKNSNNADNSITQHNTHTLVLSNIENCTKSKTSNILNEKNICQPEKSDISPKTTAKNQKFTTNFSTQENTSIKSSESFHTLQIAKETKDLAQDFCRSSSSSTESTPDLCPIVNNIHRSDTCSSYYTTDDCGCTESLDSLENCFLKNYHAPADDNVDKSGSSIEEPKRAEKRKFSGEDMKLRIKRPCVYRKNRQKVLVSTKSPVIEGDFDVSQRVTRRRLLQLLLDKRNVQRKTIDCTPGRLVWGFFHGWWPALIVKAEDVGMISTPGKIWVSWIGELRISELNEKYVDYFSSNLEAKLNSLETNTKTKGSNRKHKEVACLKTIQLLRKYFFFGPLLKPYASWMKKNIIPLKERIDELILYPYPENISERLEDFKRMNAEKTEKYLRQQEKERLSKVIEVKTSSKKVQKIEKPIKEGGINIMDQKPGMIVWAKMQGYSLWPCVIMDYQHLNRKQPNVAHQWVMWYGDYKYSQVEYHQILTFIIGMEQMEAKIRSKKDELFCKAVLHASKDYCEKFEYSTESWVLDDVIHLFYTSKDRFKLKKAELSEPNDDDLYSQTIKKQLRKQINNQPVSEERKQKILQCEKLKMILKRKVSLEYLCVTCLQSHEKLEEHPFFFAAFCTQCLEEFRPKVFAYGNDGKCFFCTLCGGDDLVAMCDKMDCPRVFCTACIKYIISPQMYEDILQKHPWYCFLCDPSQLTDEKSVVNIRKDWKNRLISIYRINCDDRTPSNLERLDRNKKIRVLSLFDGIGTGLVVLKRLNIRVERYYASEIDEDSMRVSFFNHGHEIEQLGDVRDIDERKIREIAPIDLLIGGSPCNELSLANPKRRGLDDPEGTGVLFYDYCRIKKLVKKHNKKRHLFWLFENVASMPKKYRAKISENLGREPKFLDSADFSAQHRPRLYWGNIPWGPYQVNDVVLQDVLRSQCNRQALVKKIMTVTTRTNSLNQTKENLKPVLMEGKKESLWVTELEEIFGFPQHYTDTNLCKTRRLQLIGKAWSVQTLTAILRPIFYI